MPDASDQFLPGPQADLPAGPGHHLWPRRILAGICGTILMAMMLVTIVDVIGRYVFNSPLIGATELTELLLVSVIFIGLPAVSLDDEHVTVDLLVTRLPDWCQPWRKAALSLITAAILAVVAWRLWLYGDQIAAYNSVTSSLRLPVAPVAWLCACCTGASVLITLYVAVRNLMRPLK